MTTQADTIRVRDIVSLADIGRRLEVSRATVAHWRSRYGDFPAAITHIGEGRQAPKGEKSAGTPLFDWSEVCDWAKVHGRLPD